MAMVTPREWTSSPAWNCFRADFRRRWRAGYIVRALGILFLIAGLQLALSLAIQQLWTAAGRFGLVTLLSDFSLYSPLTQAFGTSRSASPNIQSYLFLQGIVALPGLACRFLMPAAAASSITPDREQRRISELILAGLAPRQILVAKGLAAVLPFLGAAAAALIAWAATWQLAPGADQWRRSMGYSMELMLLSGSVANTVGLLVSAAIQVCISALARRTMSAMVACYGFECLLVPGLYLIGQVGWALAPFWGIGLSQWQITLYLAPGLTVLLLQAVTLCLLWPRALRALAYQD